jgi:putative PEP-CTERM system TPR-repeat lipoprotein
MTRHSIHRSRRFLLPVLVSALLAAAPPFAAAGFEEAQKYYDTGDLKSAVVELKNALQEDSRNAEARFLLGRVYLAMQSGAEAEEELRRAEELGVDPQRLRLDLADAMLMQRKFLDVLRSLAGSSAGVSDAEKAALAARRGMAYAGMNKRDAAQRSFDEALELDPGNEEASLGQLTLGMGNLGSIDEAGPPVAAFLQKFPDNIEALLMSAELQRRQGDFAAALAALDRVLALRPQELRALHGRSGVLIAQGKLEETKVELDGADAVRKGLVMTEYLRGVIALQEKDYESAKRHLELVLRAAPGHVQSQLALGVISFWRDDLQIAEEYLGRVVPAMPDEFGQAKVDAAKILGAVRLKLKQPEKAIEVLEPVAAWSSDAQLMALLGSAYAANGERDQGLDWLSRAVEAAPDTVGLRTLLASALLAGGETDRAISELQAAVDLGEDALQVDVLRVLAHLRNGEHDQALEVALSLEKERPGDPVALNLTGLAYLAKGELDKATERFIGHWPRIPNS